VNTRTHARWIRIGAVIGLVAAGCAAPPPSSPPMPGLERIEHIVVIFAENRSFDHLYGRFPRRQRTRQRDGRPDDAARS
jgi:phospholipase C